MDAPLLVGAVLRLLVNRSGALVGKSRASRCECRSSIPAKMRSQQLRQTWSRDLVFALMMKLRIWLNFQRKCILAGAARSMSWWPARSTRALPRRKSDWAFVKADRIRRALVHPSKDGKSATGALGV